MSAKKIKDKYNVVRRTEHYEIATNQRTGEKCIRCLHCGLTSWHSEDVRHRFCAYCNRFYDLEEANNAIRQETEES